MPSTRELLNRAETLLELGRTDEATTTIHDVLAGEPENQSAFILLSRALRGSDPEASYNAATTAIALDPESTSAQHQAAFAASAKRDFDVALGHADQLVKLAPQSSNSHQAVAQIICNKGKKEHVEEARAAAAKAVELNPTSAIAWYASGRVEVLAENPEVAEAHLRKALEINPSATWAQQELAAIKTDSNELASAMAVLQGVLAIDPVDEWSRRQFDRNVMMVLTDFLWAALLAVPVLLIIIYVIKEQVF